MSVDATPIDHPESRRSAGKPRSALRNRSAKASNLPI